MTKKELHIIKTEVSRAWLAMALWERQNLHLFKNRQDVNQFEENNDVYKGLRNDWYILAVLCDKLGIEWLDTDSAIKVSEISTEIYRATKN